MIFVINCHCAKLFLVQNYIVGYFSVEHLFCTSIVMFFLISFSRQDILLLEQKLVQPL